MSNPAPLQERFSGFQRDVSREQLPKDALWDCLDFIPDLGAPLRKRGGWTTYGAELSGIDAAATEPARVFFAAFSTFSVGASLDTSSQQVLAWDDNGKLFDVTNGVDRGDTTVPLHTPSFFRDLVIWGDGKAAPKKYDGTSIADLGGSPPSNARCSAVWNERLVLSGSSSTAALRATLYFSEAGNAESWDTTNAFFRTRDTVEGLAVLGTSIIVFHPGSVTKIYPDGSPPAPPSSTGIGNLGQKVLFEDVGIHGPLAFAVKGESVIWADDSGVYSTDGTSLIDLTDRGGIRNYWQAIFSSSAEGSRPQVAVATWRDYALVSVTSAGEYVDFLVCDLAKKNWFRFSNITALNFSPRYGRADELYFSNRQTKYVGEISDCFSPTSVNQADGDGGAIAPSLATRYFTFAAGPDRVKRVYLTYDLRGDALARNSIQPSYITTPEDSSYSDFPGTSLFTATSEGTRKRMALNRKALGFGLKFTQEGNSHDTRIHRIEGEVGPLETGRL